MEIINISKKNEVYIKIDSEASTAQEICDHFTFMVPGYTFMPAYRNRLWDGKIRLFNVHNRLLYGGLFEHLCKFLYTRDYKVKFDSDFNNEKIKIKKDFIDSLKLQVIPRDNQMIAANNALTWEMGMHPNYLWTLPMFHCNGWCFPWTLAAVAGAAICLRQVREDAIYEAFRKDAVTHFCGAPVVLNTLLNAESSLKQGLPSGIKVMTAGAAPPAAVILGMETLGFDVIQVYGLTETYGPMIVSAWRREWDNLSANEKATLKARQGVSSILAGAMIVADPETMQPVPWDGLTQGEVFMRGNIVMKGYLKNPETTARSFAGGWFHSGDLAVCHPDGYIQIKDRSKDIIISGGENISSIEIEDVLFSHPKILEAAVVAKSDEKWGEHPCAFVTLKPGESMSENDVIQFWRDNLARFKIPKTVIFGSLEKTSTGKVQKYLLREIAEHHDLADTGAGKSDA